ncbi:MAG TPA: enhanced serine sensitivity protein SseB C-terminal domain-containing protein [Acidimicrobiales bacterium]|nr:enhanced serine sensitivity protein SseB C-terminal domain-containing protein [Acidimicrobiales bacterium]
MELEAAVAAAARDPGRRAELRHALWDAELLIPLPELPGAPARALDEGTLALPVVESGGRRYVPVFTSPEALRRYVPEDVPTAVLTGKALARAWPADAWMALNPRSEASAILGPDEVVRLPGEPPVAPSNPIEERFAVGEPAEEPEELIELVRRYCRSRPEVVAAYRALVLVDAPGRRPQLVVGVELDEGADVNLVLRGLEATGRESAVPLLGLVSIRRDDPGAVARYMLERTQPIYRRSP